MLNLDDVGVSIGLDVSGVQSGAADVLRAFQQIENGGDHMASTIVRSAGLIVAAVVGIAAAIAGAVVGATLDWATQIDNLRGLLGGTIRDAAGFAVAAKEAGVSVEDAGTGLNSFVRGLAASQEQLKQASSDFADATSQIASDHKDAMARIGEDWTNTQRESAAQIAEIWSSLKETQANIAADLADTIAGIEEGLAERLSQIDDARTESMQRFAEQAQKINADAAKEIQAVNAATKQSLADLARQQNAAGIPERFRRAADLADAKKAILDKAKAEKAAIEERRREQLADNARQQAQAAQQFAKQEALAEKTAQKQIDAANKVADKQVEAAQKAADKQAAIAEAQLAKAAKANDRRIADEAKANAKAIAAAQKQFDKAQLSTPLLKAFDKLGIKITDSAGNLRPALELFDEFSEKFSKLKDGAEKSGLAFDVFGRGGADFIDFLNKVGDAGGLEKFKQLADTLGLIPSEDDIANAKEFKKNVNDIMLEVQGLAFTIGKELIPALNDLIPLLKGAVEMLKGGDASGIVGVVAGIFGGVIHVVAGALITVSGILIAIVGAFTAFAFGVAAVIGIFIGTLTGNQELINRSFKVWQAGLAVLLFGINVAIVGFVDGIVATFQKLFDALFGHSIIPDLMNGFNAFLTFLGGLVPSMLAVGTNIVNALVSGLASGVTAITNTAQTIADSIKNTITNALGMHSPSRVADGMGRDFIAGFQRGLGTEGGMGALLRKQLAGAGIGNINIAHTASMLPARAGVGGGSARSLTVHVSVDARGGHPHDQKAWEQVAETIAEKVVTRSIVALTHS